MILALAPTILLVRLVAVPIIPFIPLIAAGIGAAVTGVELAKQPSAPKASTMAASETQQAKSQQAAAIAQAQALRNRRGMASTELTSPLGVSSGPADTKSATLGT